MIRPVLVDSNVLLDIASEDPEWLDWSAGTLEQIADRSVVVINAVIYAEISIRYETIEEVEEVFPSDVFRRDPVPLEAAFLAGKAFVEYRRRGGERTGTIPDFFIGAHASVSGMRLLTRDPHRYRSYFPRLALISP